jgi:ankyrin repeat protein
MPKKGRIMMAKRSSPDIDILLSALLLLSVIIGGLHHFSLHADGDTQVAAPKNMPEKVVPVVNEKIPNPLADAKVPEILREIQDYKNSGSAETITKMIAGLPVKKMIEVLTQLLANRGPLKRDDCIEIILGAAAFYQKTEDRNRILDFILDPKYPDLRQGTPIVYIAAYGDYPEIIPAIKTWYAGRVANQANHAELCQELEARALGYAIDHKDLKALKSMVTHGVTMNKTRASILLNEAVKAKSGCKTITFLVDQGADINYAVKGLTPLLHAIKRYDLAAVKKLVERGADVNKIADNDVGNPRQVAAEAVKEAAGLQYKKGNKNRMKQCIRAVKNAVAIEEYLIEQGAKS